jgi:hypothetical protein
MDFSLFPSLEQWGTGDEALDNKLSSALKKTQLNLSLSSIQEFYFFGLNIKTRAYNPGFTSTVEFVTKALLFCLSPDEYIDHLFLKIKGDYFQKERINFTLESLESILQELKKGTVYRYKNQIDISLHEQAITERNPFIKALLKRSPEDLHVKIIFKDFKTYLSGEKSEALFDDPLFRALRMGEKVLFIDKLGELWYHQGQIYSFKI